MRESQKKGRGWEALGMVGGANRLFVCTRRVQRMRDIFCSRTTRGTMQFLHGLTVGHG
ncbi:hypothetical protein VFPFJ_05145 [Purpureocillium lilacinum]|uniref:Uncharacterized protein n=1 Tax=Purpureocillium lilacinum TaxID=33203 RepID=A0A179HKQ4_PURLI|nr:hypothetical protein VFPFJ_05145 [Purpureocillium lilacinum]OAQ90986.1 hypothetical protein VFPFJ_05145 [Purpureocillium lilacinum]